MSPLRAIRYLTERVDETLKDTASAEASRDLERIRTRVMRAERVLDQLLTYAMGRDAPTDVAPIRPQELVADLIELERPPKAFDVRVEAETKPFLAPRAPLEIVLRNLISNAIKHHDRDRARIEIKVSTADSCCHIEVSDDGPGIPAERASHVFAPFEAAASSLGGQTGIGLALVKRLVESNGGKITFVSNGEARGTTFHVWWPISCAEPGGSATSECLDGRGVKPP
jgi:signal transduction histidine kinase